MSKIIALVLMVASIALVGVNIARAQETPTVTATTAVTPTVTLTATPTPGAPDGAPATGYGTIAR